MSKVSIGRVVHYRSHGTPIREDGSQEFPSTARMAFVTEVAEDGFTVGLLVVNPDGLHFHPLSKGGSTFDGDENPAGGTWSWPPRV